LVSTAVVAVFVMDFIPGEVPLTKNALRIAPGFQVVRQICRRDGRAFAAFCIRADRLCGFGESNIVAKQESAIIVVAFLVVINVQDGIGLVGLLVTIDYFAVGGRIELVEGLGGGVWVERVLRDRQT